MTPSDQPACPALGVGARAVVRDRDGRLLLIRRSADVGMDPGRWELPGGKMDFGEELRDALRREVAEETGLDIEIGPPVHVSHFTKDPFWVTTVTFACELKGGEVRLSDEHTEFAWVEHAELGDRTFERTIQEQIDAYAAFARVGGG